jgi:hypothetical protein
LSKLVQIHDSTLIVPQDAECSERRAKVLLAGTDFEAFAAGEFNGIAGRWMFFGM